MKNIFTALSTLLLVCVVLSTTTLAQPLQPLQPIPRTIDPTTGQHVVSTPPQSQFVPRTPPGAEVQAMQMQELRVALQELGVLVQQARRNDNPLAQELQTAVQNLTRAMEVAFSARPATQSPAPGANASRNPLAAEVEKAYIDLARQYFYLYIGTPDKATVTLPVMAGSNPIVIHQEPREIVEMVEVDGSIIERRRQVVLEFQEPVEVVEEEPVKSEREEILENFVECIKKISPAARITLISELIRTAHGNEELKMLEGLLDEVLNPPAVNRMPMAPDAPRRPPGTVQPMPLQPEALRQSPWAAQYEPYEPVPRQPQPEILDIPPPGAVPFEPGPRQPPQPAISDTLPPPARQPL